MYKIKKYKCNNSTLQIREGDICDSKCDVIVSSDNVGLSMAVGVSRAIHDKAGIATDIDLDKIKQVDLGDVFVTSAGDLPQRYIFHCIADKRGCKRNKDILPIIVNRTVDKCLQMLPHLGVYSIAFPAIGTGAVGIDTSLVAQTMLEVIADGLQRTNHNLSVEIVAWGTINRKKWIEAISKNNDFEPICDDDDDADKESQNDNCEVFISYSWHNESVAIELDKWLDELGVRHFLDRRVINGGEDHKEVILENLRKVKLVLFLSSKESNVSPAVKGEMSNAIALRLPIIPLRLDMTPYRDSFMYDLVNLIWVDLTQGLECKKEELRKYLHSYNIKF